MAWYFKTFSIASNVSTNELKTWLNTIPNVSVNISGGTTSNYIDINGHRLTTSFNPTLTIANGCIASVCTDVGNEIVVAVNSVASDATQISSAHAIIVAGINDNGGYTFRQVSSHIWTSDNVISSASTTGDIIITRYVDYKGTYYKNLYVAVNARFTELGAIYITEQGDKFQNIGGLLFAKV